MVKRVAPSVVNVFTTKTVKSSVGPHAWPFFDEPFFRRFFGDPQDGKDFYAPRARKERSLGSGVIVSADGHILTANHVVEGADEVKVSLAKDRKEYTAKVVGRDPRTDIAVLKIDAEDLPVATLADSDKIEVGDVVLAIGNPFGVGQTVTMGIVSATGRGGMNIGDYEDFIQTDAAINPGNSGGALVDAEGRLIGINTAILSRSGGNHGVGFAVPVNLARNVMDRLLTDGRVVRGYLGVMIQDLTPELAKEFGLPNLQGALIGEVTDGGAADAAGLKTGDVIVEFDGKNVPDSRKLKLMVGQVSPGSKVDVKVLRQGKEKKLAVTLKEAPEPRLAGAPQNESKEDTGALKGVGVGDINPATRRQYQLPSDLQGALVTQVDPDSASFEAGLRQGDVIQEINRQPVRNAAEAVEACREAKGDRTLVRVWSRGGSRFVVVDESKS
jgi:serine protease Do